MHPHVSKILRSLGLLAELTHIAKSQSRVNGRPLAVVALHADELHPREALPTTLGTLSRRVLRASPPEMERTLLDLFSGYDRLASLNVASNVSIEKVSVGHRSQGREMR